MSESSADWECGPWATWDETKAPHEPSWREWWESGLEFIAAGKERERLLGRRMTIEELTLFHKEWKLGGP